MSPRIQTVTADSPYKEIWRSIFRNHINSLPVVDKNKRLIGIISKEDLLKTLYPGYEDLIDEFSDIADFEKMEQKVKELSSLKAKDVMCKKVIYTREDTQIMRALSRMIVRRLSQLPVLSNKNEVIGVVTKGDIFYALFKKQMGSEKKSKRSTTGRH